MKAKRIYAGSLVALLLCASSFAISCEISCNLLLSGPACHASAASAGESTPANMAMDGMDMPGMHEALPDSNDGVVGQSNPQNRHATLVDVGMCQRPCGDRLQAASSGSEHCTGGQFQPERAIATNRLANNCMGIFHDARDHLHPRPEFSQFSLSVTLRI
jgi:hypothetical protein